MGRTQKEGKTMNTLKSISYYTEKGGVAPAVLAAVKAQSLTMHSIDLSSFEYKNGTYYAPVAIDQSTGETLYLKITASVGKMSTASPKKATKKAVAPVEVPNLFD